MRLHAPRSSNALLDFPRFCFFHVAAKPVRYCCYLQPCMQACNKRCRKRRKVRSVVSRTFGADEDLVFRRDGGVGGGGGVLGPRAMTSLRAHVILLRRNPISGDSQLSRMGREGRSNLRASGSYSPRRRRAREGGAHPEGLDSDQNGSNY